MGTSKARKSAPARRDATKAVVRKQAAAAAATANASPAPKPALKSVDGDNKPGAKKATRIRGSFVMPEPDYALIAKLKLAARRNGLKAKKSELFRLGLRMLDSLSAQELRDRILSLRAPEKRGKK